MKISHIFFTSVVAAVLAACGGNVQESSTAEATTSPTPGEVNIYSHRHYESDEKLFAQFEAETGIKVNVVKAKADQLIERLKAEGENSPADLLMTVDVGRLTRAKDAGLLQQFVSAEVLEPLPGYLKDPDGQWVALTKRARVIVYNKDKVKADELPDYEQLADAAYKDRVITRSSSNIYNQSWIASMIAANGEEATEAWAKSLVGNFAREPEGNDRGQMRAVAAGVADFAVVNTYYLGLLVNGPAEDQEVASRIKIHFPNQTGRGTHINVSGIGITKSSKNLENAEKLVAYLLSPAAQKIFAETNFEYPVLPGVASSELVQSWGEFKEDTRSLNEVGKLGPDALKLADRAGWK
ncbi:MAG: Fe(3+) ABC transporter substrate-binding protein [Verrucomicrobiota bacterium]